MALAQQRSRGPADLQVDDPIVLRRDPGPERTVLVDHGYLLREPFDVPA
jgi:hypothetical protein